MGRSAVKSHHDSTGHKKKLTDAAESKKTVSILQWAHAPSESENPSSDVKKSDAPSTSADVDLDRSQTLITVPCQTKLKTQGWDVTKAEIIWALDTVKKHRSYHSSDDQKEIFCEMFPDSEVARQFTMSEDKLAYVIAFGLAPAFEKELLVRLQSVKEFALSFDEAHNKTIQKKQLDLCVRYFDETTCTVTTEYVTSIFLRRSRSQNILSAVKEAAKGLDMSKLLQISMDGPNVNHAFHRRFCEEFKDSFERELFQTGVCSLHVVSGALQHGHKEVKWNLDGILRAMFRIWKDSPARRADFVEINDSEIFPLQFCSTRWIENVKCVQRALHVFENVKTYCQEVKPKPDIVSFTTVEKAMQDDWTRTRLEFFKAVASDFEPFLRQFQTEKPMFPFLFSSLCEILCNCLRRFVSENFMNEINGEFSRLTKTSIQRDSDNLKRTTETDIGFGSKRSLPRKYHPSQKLDFFAECQRFLIGIASKMIERLPLNLRMVRGASALSPLTILKKSEKICEKRFDIVLEQMLDAKQLTTSQADAAKHEYSQFIRSSATLKRLQSFDIDNDRLDRLFVEIVMNDKMLQNLWLVTRKVLVLFHGQGAIERGFSINKDTETQNMKERTVVAQRVVYNAIERYGSVLKVPITQDLVSSVRSSSMRRKLYLKDTKCEKEKEEALGVKRKLELDLELKSIEWQREKLDEQTKALEIRMENIKKAKLLL